MINASKPLVLRMTKLLVMHKTRVLLIGLPYARWLRDDSLPLDSDGFVALHGFQDTAC